MLNTHAAFFIATSKGDRLTVTLPENAELTAVLLNGEEVPKEVAVAANEFIIHLPPSAGQVSKFLLEISYSLKGARASKLIAPTLSKEIPVVNTLWRVWIPDGYYYLGHSRFFSQIPESDAQNSLYRLYQEQSGRPNVQFGGFKLVGQGQVYNYIRQGRPESLFVLAMSKELFSILVWAIVIAAGIFMLKVKGNNRVMIILGIILFMGILYQFHPVLVIRILKTAWFPITLVLLLWLAQWGFTNMPELRKNAALRRQKASETKQKKKAKPQTETKPE